MIGPKQLEIFGNAPFYTKYFAGSGGKGHLIPDTPKAKHWAIQQGATHFETFSVLRAGNHHPAPLFLKGDISFVFSTYQTKPRLAFTSLKAKLKNFFPPYLGAGACNSIMVQMIGPNCYALSLPCHIFGLKYGGLYLQEYAEQIAYDFNYAQRIRNAESPEAYCNLFTKIAIPGTEWAKCMRVTEHTWRTFEMLTYDEIWNSSQSNSVPRLHCASEPDNHTIDTGTLERLSYLAPKRWSTKYRSNNYESLWKPPLPLLSSQHNITAHPHEASDIGVKCAISLLQWCRQFKITEFRRRDASRAVDGTFTRDYGLDEALNILLAHGYLREFTMPRYTYPGRRPSPWYVLNPLWNGYL